MSFSSENREVDSSNSLTDLTPRQVTGSVGSSSRGSPSLIPRRERNPKDTLTQGKPDGRVAEEAVQWSPPD